MSVSRCRGLNRYFGRPDATGGCRRRCQDVVQFPASRPCRSTCDVQCDVVNPQAMISPAPNFKATAPTPKKRGVPQGARLVQSCSAIRKVEKPTETVFDGEVDEHNRIN
ncbi:hypothetical protein GEV33_002930 [Tenebrio molitor]|uniref:Uncharacterized protein n=1 Tax=Tenebrio molitor TaxID=7067 RepID=A0A8J6LNZ6_TENMO|nr:hypothetical protein GEV33_002930 [Tenebrio molitor]